MSSYSEWVERRRERATAAESYVEHDPDDDCGVLPPRPCSTPGCKGTTHDIGVHPKCRRCQPENQWRLR